MPPNSIEPIFYLRKVGKKNKDLSILPDNRPALKGEHCLNCGTPLDKQENYCHYCGQRNDQRRLNFWDVISESFKSYFSVDNRAIHSLIPLLTRPGKLTREFVEGKRQQYVHPIRMYLTVSIVYFSLISLSNFLGRPELGLVKIKNQTAISDDSTGQNLTIESEKPFIEFSLEDDIVDSPEISKNAGVLDSSSIDSSQVNSTWADSVVNWNTKNAEGDSIAESITGLDLQALKANVLKWDTVPNPGPYKRPRAYYLENEQALERISRFIADQDTVEVITALSYLELENNRLNRFMYIEIQKGRTLEWTKFLNYFVGKLPIILFLFLPLFALSFWAVYIRRDYFYIEHLIFLFHVQTVFFLLLLLEWLINFSWPGVDLDAIILLTFVVYSILAMRRFYRQGWFKTLVKWTLVNMGFLVFGTVFFILAFGIVFLAY